jgi:hypothetical protein
MIIPRLLANVKWALPGLAALGLALGGRESRRYLLAGENGSCSAATLDGTYDWGGAGLVKTAGIHRNIWTFAPMAEDSGPYTVFDGTGTVTSIIVTHRFSPGNSFVVTRTGSYTVKQDCTGEISWNTATHEPLLQTLAVNPDGRSADVTNTSTEMIVAGTTDGR